MDSVRTWVQWIIVAVVGLSPILAFWMARVLGHYWRCKQGERHLQRPADAPAATGAARNGKPSRGECKGRMEGERLRSPGVTLSPRRPLTTISTCRLPQREQTSRSFQSGIEVSAPHRAAISVRGHDRDVPDDKHGSPAAYRSARSALSSDSSLTSDPRMSCSRCRTIAVIAMRSAAV